MVKEALFSQENFKQCICHPLRNERWPEVWIPTDLRAVVKDVAGWSGTWKGQGLEDRRQGVLEKRYGDGLLRTGVDYEGPLKSIQVNGVMCFMIVR